MYKKILVPLDRNAGAEAALPVAADLAVRFGEPAEEILGEARGSDADLVVMATHGRSCVARLVLGSVAEAVLRRSEVPIVLVRHGLPAAA